MYIYIVARNSLRSRMMMEERNKGQRANKSNDAMEKNYLLPEFISVTVSGQPYPPAGP